MSSWGGGRPTLTKQRGRSERPSVLRGAQRPTGSREGREMDAMHPETTFLQLRDPGPIASARAATPGEVPPVLTASCPGPQLHSDPKPWSSPVGKNRSVQKPAAEAAGFADQGLPSCLIVVKKVSRARRRGTGREAWTGASKRAGRGQWFQDRGSEVSESGVVRDRSSGPSALARGLRNPRGGFESRGFDGWTMNQVITE